VKEGIMSNAQAARDQQPPLDPRLQNKLITKFGKTLMRQGFTALPQLVQRYYRHVPGNALYDYEYERDTETKTWAKKSDTKRVVCEVSYMTPTEYSLMTAIWSHWWTSDNDPWPSVDRLCQHLNKSERQVRRYLERLRDKGFMLSVEQFNSEGKQISNRYDFSPFLRRLVEYLDALEQLQKQSQDISKSVQNDRERVSSLTGRRVSEVAPKTDRSSDADLFDTDDSDSSGEAAGLKKEEVGSSAGTCSHIAHETIRSEETTTNPDTSSSSRNSKPSSGSPEISGVERAEGATAKNTSDKLSKWQEMALAQGVSLVQQDALESYLHTCPRPLHAPILVEQEIDPLSKRWNNVQHLTSNRTQATKLWQYARLKGMDHETIEDTFREWARVAATIPPHVDNKMAWFFKALRLEVLKALLPYERLTSRTQEQATDTETDDTSSVQEEEQSQITSPLDEEGIQEHDALPGSTSEELEQVEEEQQFHSHRVVRPARTRTHTQKEAREHYATQVRDQLRLYGVIGSLEMIVDHEHSCGCPLYYGDWTCVRCNPKRTYEQDVLVLIDTILEH